MMSPRLRVISLDALEQSETYELELYFVVFRCIQNFSVTVKDTDLQDNK